MRLFPEIQTFPQEGRPFPVHAYDVRWVLLSMTGKVLHEGPWLDFGLHRADDFDANAVPKVSWWGMAASMDWWFTEIQMRRTCVTHRVGVFHRHDEIEILAGVTGARNRKGEAVMTHGGMLVRTPTHVIEFCRDGHVTARERMGAEQGEPVILNPEHLQQGRN